MLAYILKINIEASALDFRPALAALPAEAEPGAQLVRKQHLLRRQRHRMTAEGGALLPVAQRAGVAPGARASPLACSALRCSHDLVEGVSLLWS